MSLQIEIDYFLLGKITNIQLLFVTLLVCFVSVKGERSTPSPPPPQQYMHVSVLFGYLVQ